MSTAPPTAPQLIKGGLALLDPTTGAVLSVIPLQYNPTTLSRSFQIKGAGSETGDRIEALRLKGPPVETIKVEVEIDAVDLLEVSDDQTVQSGLHPVLAQLEIIVCPPSGTLQSNNDLASSGSLEIIAIEAALTVFVFGPKRIVPVRINELSITEEAFDAALNPILAKINFTMRVLSIDDISFTDVGGSLFMAYLQAKEQLAHNSKPGSLGTLGIRGFPT